MSTTSRFTTWTFILLFLLITVLVIHLLGVFLTPVVLAIVIVSLFKPVHLWVLRITNERAYVASSIATLLALLCILVPLTLFLIALVQQSVALYQSIEKITTASHLTRGMASLEVWLDKLQGYFADFGIKIAPNKIISFALSLAQDFGQRLYHGVGSVATNLVGLVLDFVLTLALVFVFFVSGASIRSFMMELVPLPLNEKERLIKRFQELSSAVFIGNGLISLFEGLIGGLSCLVFGISGSLLWGLAIAISAFLPLVGASVVVIPAAVYLFLVGHVWQAVVFLIINAVQLAVLEMVVKPRLIGTKSQMHAVLVFLSILAGMEAYGFLGIFYGPLLVTIFLSMTEIYKEHYRQLLVKIEAPRKT
jgi:predicted PurR-regulated permease PerM